MKQTAWKVAMPAWKWEAGPQAMFDRQPGKASFWNKFLGSRWSCVCSGHHISNRSSDNFDVPGNALLDQKCRLQPASPICQASSGLWLPVPSHPRQRWLRGPSQSDIFYLFLFLVLYPVKASCLPPHMQFSGRLPAARSSKVCFTCMVFSKNNFLILRKARKLILPQGLQKEPVLTTCFRLLTVKNIRE